jgi:uncharacterized protein YdgA (DUF945 family)
MSKKIIAAGVGVVVLGIVAVVAGAVVTGFQTKKALQAGAANWPMVKVVEQHYSQGLFSSTQTVALQIGCAGAGAQPMFTVRQRVKHGPFPGFSGFGAALIETELLVPDNARKVLDEITGGQPPVTARTAVAFDGTLRSLVTMPAFHFRGPNGEQLSFQGLRADITSKGESLRYDVAVPSLNVAAKDQRMAVEMRLTGLAMHGEHNGGSMWLRPGTSSGEIASFEFSAMSQVASPVPPLRFALSQIKASTETTLADALIASRSQLTGQGTIGGVKLDKIELQASLKRLHAPTYAKLMQRFVDSAASCDTQAAIAPQLLLQQLQQDLAALLPFGPEYALDKLALEIDGKRGELAYSVAINGVSADELQAPLPALLMSKGLIRGRALVPAVWVERTLASFGGGQKDPATQAELMNVMLAKLTGEGYIVRDGEMLSAQLSFDKGQLTVNGKQVSRP